MLNHNDYFIDNYVNHFIIHFGEVVGYSGAFLIVLSAVHAREIMKLTSLISYQKPKCK